MAQEFNYAWTDSSLIYELNTDATPPIKKTRLDGANAYAHTLQAKIFGLEGFVLKRTHYCAHWLDTL